MRLQEFADAEEQINLWKLISDSVWNSIKFQAIKQEQKRLDLQKTQSKSMKTAKSIKKPKTEPRPMSLKSLKKSQPKSDNSAIPAKQQNPKPQTQKQQVLPKVFSNTQKSNLATPQTPVTSATSISLQNAAKTGSDRLRAPDSVANTQRQLDPFATSDVVKRLVN